MSDIQKSVPIAASAAGNKALAGPLSRLLREPLVHFLLIGAAVFGLYGLVAPPVSARRQRDRHHRRRRRAAESAVSRDVEPRPDGDRIQWTSRQSRP